MSHAEIKNIFLIGDIEDKLVHDTLTSLWDDPNVSKIKKLNILIETIGGDLHCCFALLDSIQYLKAQFGFTINTFGLGKVASAGFFLFLLGDYRVLFPSTRVFVHEHMTINDETSTYSIKMKEFQEDKAIHDIYCAYVMNQLNLTSAQAKKLLRKNKWLTNKEIEKFNIITRNHE